VGESRKRLVSEPLRRRFDPVMMLAVFHHLLLRNQIPMGRSAIYAHITEVASRDAFAEYFTTVDELTLANGRIQLRLRKK
jgi:hypothetical protein